MPSSSQVELKSTSLELQLKSEQWLLESGLISDTSVDTLLMYAYAQLGVEQVKLTIDADDKGDGQKPIVVYEIILSKKLAASYRVINKLASNPTLFNRLRTLWMLRRGVPYPKTIEAEIIKLASLFLPERYKITVEWK